MSGDAKPAQAKSSLQSPASRFVLKRFAIKCALIVLFALAQAWTSWGFADALVALATGSALMNVTMALLLRQPVRSADLSYWDEALAFAAIAILAAFFWHAPPTPAAPAVEPTAQHFR